MLLLRPRNIAQAVATATLIRALRTCTSRPLAQPFRMAAARAASSAADTPTPSPIVGIGQIQTTADVEANFAQCAELAKQAAEGGACLLFLPEAFHFIGANWRETISRAEVHEAGSARRSAEAAGAGVTLAPKQLVRRSAGDARLAACRSSSLVRAAAM